MNGAMSSQITSLTFVYSTVYSDADQRKHQSSASLAFVRGIHRGPVNSPHKWPVTRKMFPFDDVIMCGCNKVGPQHNDSRGYISWSVLYFLPWLTCWGQNKMTAILQMTFSMKIAVISLKFHWSLLSKVQLTTIRFFLIQVMAWCRTQAIIWINGSIVYWRIYASLGLMWPLLLTWFNFNPSMDK